MDNQYLFFLYESLVMIFGALFAGLIPWLLKNHTKINRKWLNWCNIFGAGVFVGVCLIMIMPEGVEQIFESAHFPEEEDGADYDGLAKCQVVGLCLAGGFVFNMLCDKIIAMFQEDSSQGAGVAIGIGMFIHGMTDGIVMAASNWGGDSEVAFTVFLAMFIHKLPASFGLSASVIDQGDMTKWKSLLVIGLFSLSPPIGGYLTLAVLAACDADEPNSLAPGVLLLFSGGTVLYVACCHIIPEAFSNGMTGCYDVHTIMHPTTIPPQVDARPIGSKESFGSGSDQVDAELCCENVDCEPKQFKRTTLVNRVKEGTIQMSLVIVGILIPLTISLAMPEEE